jgi:Na+-translocating ferredoxin:NAD+ oxidoreductase RnfC subunit
MKAKKHFAPSCLGCSKMLFIYLSPHQFARFAKEELSIDGIEYHNFLEEIKK